jgi:MFS transporter, AAHS family, 4-hydroxybenzoate transporter
MDRTIDVGALIETRPLGRFQYLVGVLGLLILFVDGLDNSAIQVSAPTILKAFHTGRGALGPVLGAGSAGAILGALAFGYLADRLGRRRAILIAVFFYSLANVASAGATSLVQLGALRFIAGMGVAGVVPTTIALLTETAPRAYRASFIMLALIGIALGHFVTGLVAAALLGPYGWPSLFVAVGLAGVALSAVLVATLPESARWLAVARPDAPQLGRLVARIAPELELAPETRFALAEPPRRRVALGELFAEDRRLATPLLWIGYFAEALTFMTLLGWMTVFLTTAGLSQTQAALTFSYASIGGIVAILVMALGRVLDRAGPMALVLTSGFAIVSVALMGLDGLPHPIVIGCAVTAVAFCSATHNSLNGTVGLFYPTAIRGKGVGYATGMGRVGLMVGPVAAGLLLGANLPLEQVLFLVALPYVVVAVACAWLGRLYMQRYTAAATLTPEAAAAAATSSALRTR